MLQFIHVVSYALLVLSTLEPTKCDKSFLERKPKFGSNGRPSKLYIHPHSKEKSMYLLRGDSSYGSGAKLTNLIREGKSTERVTQSMHNSSNVGRTGAVTPPMYSLNARKLSGSESNYKPSDGAAVSRQGDRISYPSNPGGLSGIGSYTVNSANRTAGIGVRTSYPSHPGGLSGTETYTAYPVNNPSSVGGRISYPSNPGGLSGTGSNTVNTANKTAGIGVHTSYPSHPGGLSGTASYTAYPVNNSPSVGGRISYPSNLGGLSGTGRYTEYPVNNPSSVGGRISYPSNPGSLSGTGSFTAFPANNPVGAGGRTLYPSNPGGLSGTEGYSRNHVDRTKLTSFESGILNKNILVPNNRISYDSNNRNSYSPEHNSNYYVDRYYHYDPPQRITYNLPGQKHVTYPVYQGWLPSYVYEYRNSGSKYRTLLAGLGLLNLANLSGSRHSLDSRYTPEPGEVCKFGLLKDNGAYEETVIDCNLITSFIYEERERPTINQELTQQKKMYATLSDGSLVSLNTNAPEGGSMQNLSPNGTVMSTMTAKFAINEKGSDMYVTSSMQCFVIRTTPMTVMKKPVQCGLLQAFAKQSLKPNSATRHLPTFTILFAIAACIMYK